MKRELERIIKSDRTAILIVNTHSRKGERLFSHAAESLTERGMAIAAAYPVRDPVRLPEVVRDAVARGVKLVIVGGGDGTVSSIVDYLADRDVVLGLLPLGTGNSFARTLGIPLSLDGAIDVIVNGKVADVDLGKVDGDYFANVAGVGLVAEVSRRTPRRLKRYLGRAAYGVVGAYLLLTHHPFQARLAWNGQERTVTTHQVFVANGRFQGARILAPDAHPDNRQLVIVTLDTASRWRWLRRWLAHAVGIRQGWLRGEHVVANAVTIETQPPQYIDVDGESTTHTPARFTVAPEALKVMVPQTFEEPWG